MKKFMAIATIILCFVGGSVAFAEEDLLKQPQDSLTRTIVPEEQHVSRKTAKVSLDYTPLTDEVVAYYTDLAVSYDRGEAMNSIIECLVDFQKQNGYLSYKYLRSEKVKYFKDDKGLKWARHEQRVKFSGKSAF